MNVREALSIVLQHTRDEDPDTTADWSDTQLASELLDADGTMAIDKAEVDTWDASLFSDDPRECERTLYAYKVVTEASKDEINRALED